MRDERFSAWKLEAREGDVGSGQAAAERAGVIGLGDGDLLLGDFFGPEGVGDLGLFDAVFGQVGVGPGDRSVAILF